MNEGEELIIMNTATAMMLVDVCVFYGGRRCGGVAFLPPKGHLLAMWRQWRYKPEDVLLAPDEIRREHLCGEYFLALRINLHRNKY